ncbi:MAG: winged helix-turn-helix domain-containing protein [Acidobacteria bacterium]|nr:winged helix-turn-helix domain-containing protein [Acidobacteriota bacterium]
MAREFRVGEWLVEPNLNCISRADEKISIEPKVIEVLAFLAEYPGEVLSKEQIIQAVWPDTYVSDEVLRYSITELRKAFKDDARNPQIIQTIPRRGYRLIAEVTKKAPAAEARRSIAVLAFADISSAKDQEYFCDGISEEITSSLSRIKGLRIASRTSSFAFKGKSEDIRSIGRKLGVATVLEGSVRKAEGRLRITSQLINVEDGCHLWTERYDRDLKDIFVIQDEIARSIAATLKIALTPRESKALAKAPTKDLEAYDYYLRGRQFYYQLKIKSMEFALKLFSRAIELDPAYVRAFAAIADCYSFLFMHAGSQDIHRDQADSMSRRALELDPDSAEAHASRGVAHSLKHNYSEAESEFEEAIVLDPTLFEAYYFYARVCFEQGKLEKTIQLYEKSIEVNPQDYQAPLLVAQIYSDLGDEEKAADSRRRGVRAVEARIKMHPDDTRALYMGANGLVALGEFDQGLEWAAQALALDPGEPMVFYNVACVQSLAGRYEDALDSLEKSVQSGLMHLHWLEHDSNLDPLRRYPRYKQLIKQLQNR